MDSSSDTRRWITGLVEDAGGTLGSSPTLILELRPWQPEDGPVSSAFLRIEVPVESEADIEAGMERWHGEIVRLEIETLRKPSGNSLGQIVARSPIESVGPTAELAETIARHRQPVRVVNAVLGTLELRRSFDQFTCKRRAKGLSYDVTVDVEDADDGEAVDREIGDAAARIQKLETALPSILDAIVEAKLDLYNDTWRTVPWRMSAARFKKRLKLSLVNVGHTRVTVDFDVGGMFTDHAVEVRMSPDLEIREILLS